MLIDNEKKELIDNVLTSALSGISNQWIAMVAIRSIKGIERMPKDRTLADAVINNLEVKFQVFEESTKYPLTRKNLINAIADYGVEHDMCKHCLNDNMDDEIGDVILQQALFGEYRYA